MTEKTRADILGEADTYLADNVSGDTSNADIRQRIKDLADSAYMKLDEPVPAGTLIAMQVFTTSGTYVPNPDAKSALAIATGGGGSGKNGSPDACGGAGSTAMAVVDVSAVASETVTIGAGGTSFGNGGQTSFGTHAVAGGGLSGTTGTGGTATTGTLLVPGGQGGGSSDATVPGVSFWGGRGAYGAGGIGSTNSTTAQGRPGVVVVFEFG